MTPEQEAKVREEANVAFEKMHHCIYEDLRAPFLKGYLIRAEQDAERITSLEAQVAAMQAGEAVATVTSWTNGSYHRNYKITWHGDVDEGTKLYKHAPPPAAPVVPDDLIAGKYRELLYAVSIKHPEESRHETALRYIQQAESQDNQPSAAAPQPGETK